MKAFLLKRFFFVLFFTATVVCTPTFVFADNPGQVRSFFVDANYDFNGRSQIKAALKEISSYAYFYIEDGWYKNLTEGQKREVRQNLSLLAQEFDRKIYPKLTSVYGAEWRPGIDSDNRITVLFQKMRKRAAGYFNSGDEYERVQNPASNRREMVYLNAENLFSPLLKSYLAHEFTHLITFNQKERMKGIQEEVWLNEARADYSPTLVGYSAVGQKTNLQQRIKEFISNPNDSLTEWRGEKGDYGVANIFSHYLVGRYGIKILSDSLKSSLSGIASINYALKKNGAKQTFSQVFADWAVATLVNDCSLEVEPTKRYCYQNSAELKDLHELKISPSLIVLPSTRQTKIVLNYSIKQWAGNWYRIIGGRGDLKITVKADERADLTMPYLICEEEKECAIKSAEIKAGEELNLFLSDFGENYSSLTLIPLIMEKKSSFNSAEPSFIFSLSIFLDGKADANREEEKLIQELLAQIEELERKIAEVKAKIAAILKQKTANSCGLLLKNLYFGARGREVSCLQAFLKSQGSDIYPEGIVSGWFGPLTKAAVIRFQEKYAEEILKPLNLYRGTGFVGAKTRAFINQKLKGK